MVSFRCLVTTTNVLSMLCLGEGALRGEQLNREVVKRRFLSEFEALLGHGRSHDRLSRLEDMMRPTWNTLPVDASGGISQGTARHVLRRHFGREHGWVIQGLTNGQRVDANATGNLKTTMPSVVFGLLEQQLGKRSIGLRELAVLAATIEDMVLGESVDLMGRVHTQLAGTAENTITDGFLLLFAASKSRDRMMSKSVLMRELKNIPTFFHGWRDLSLWAQDLRREVEFKQANPFETDDSESVMNRFAQVMTEEFGRAQNLECKALKNALLDVDGDVRGDGRVHLSKFYSSYLDKSSKWFSESVEYLRHHGILDESDANRPKVVVPNYINSVGNCIATSEFMSVCCINECEALLSDVEKAIATPYATPQHIAEVVSGLPSDTVATPRQLPEALVGRLNEIATHNSGTVPLQSLAFLHWMHQAYPNECPIPSKAPMEEVSGMQVVASKREMRDVIKRSAELENISDTVDEPTFRDVHHPMWFKEDELLADLTMFESTEKGILPQQLMTVCRGIAMVGALLSSVCIGLSKLRSLRSVDGLSGFSGKEGPFTARPHFV